MNLQLLTDRVNNSLFKIEQYVNVLVEGSRKGSHGFHVRFI